MELKIEGWFSWVEPFREQEPEGIFFLVFFDLVDFNLIVGIENKTTIGLWIEFFEINLNCKSINLILRTQVNGLEHFVAYLNYPSTTIKSRHTIVLNDCIYKIILCATWGEQDEANYKVLHL